MRLDRLVLLTQVDGTNGLENLIPERFRIGKPFSQIWKAAGEVTTLHSHMSCFDPQDDNSEVDLLKSALATASQKRLSGTNAYLNSAKDLVEACGKIYNCLEDVKFVGTFIRTLCFAIYVILNGGKLFNSYQDTDDKNEDIVTQKMRDASERYSRYQVKMRRLHYLNICLSLMRKTGASDNEKERVQLLVQSIKKEEGDQLPILPHDEVLLSEGYDLLNLLEAINVAIEVLESLSSRVVRAMSIPLRGNTESKIHTKTMALKSKLKELSDCGAKGYDTVLRYLKANQSTISAMLGNVVSFRDENRRLTPIIIISSFSEIYGLGYYDEGTQRWIVCKITGNIPTKLRGNITSRHELLKNHDGSIYFDDLGYPKIVMQTTISELSVIQVRKESIEHIGSSFPR